MKSSVVKNLQFQVDELPWVKCSAHSDLQSTSLKTVIFLEKEKKKEETRKYFL